MTYKPKLDPSRGFMIERCQPFTKQDVELAKRILDENDELVVGVGNAGVSHEHGWIMTAGERVDLVDYVLRDEGVDPNRYIIIPVENRNEAAQWVAEVMMVTPRWNKFYTRNFKNASMFASLQRQQGYEIETVEEQKPEKDYFELYAKVLKHDDSATIELSEYLPASAAKRMVYLGIPERVNVIYNRKDVDTSSKIKEKRALFLGGLQPFTGVYEDNNGHISNIRLALEKCDQAVIAIGSAQESYKDSDPLTAGKRVEVVRYTLLANGVDASKFYVVPIRDVSANAAYAAKVIALCPEFHAVIAGNDWTKQLFGEGNYEILPVDRNPVKGTDTPISATRVRNTVKDIIKKNHSKDNVVSEETVKEIEKSLEGMVDKATLDILEQVGFYNTMHFLAFAEE
jgi:nicotinamide-nucleotide adenylyltransferase